MRRATECEPLLGYRLLAFRLFQFDDVPVAVRVRELIGKDAVIVSFVAEVPCKPLDTAFVLPVRVVPHRRIRNGVVLLGGQRGAPRRDGPEAVDPGSFHGGKVEILHAENPPRAVTAVLLQVNSRHRSRTVFPVGEQVAFVGFLARWDVAVEIGVDLSGERVALRCVDRSQFLAVVGLVAAGRKPLIVTQCRPHPLVVRLGYSVAVVAVIVVVSLGNLDALEIPGELVHVYSRDCAENSRFVLPVEVRVRVLDVEEEPPVLGDEHASDLSTDDGRRKAVERRSFLFDAVALAFCLFASHTARCLARRR